MTQIAMLGIGDELLDGRGQDAHAMYAGDKLRPYGGALREVVIAPDEQDAIVSQLRRLAATYTHVLVTGGLGPTVDDVTRDAVAEAAGVLLVRHPDVVERLAKKYEARGRVLENVNVRQALFPQGATIYENRWGMADAFAVELGGAMVFVMPGPRREFQPIFDTYIFEQLPKAPMVVSPLTVNGVGEGHITRLLADRTLPEGVTIRFCAKFPHVEIDLSGPDADAVDAATAMVSETLGPWLAPRDPGRLLVERLTTDGLTVTAAESCTGGTIANWITDISGASAVLESSYVTYANRAKTELLGVPEETLVAHGAVSREVCTAMVQGALAAAGADVAIAATGIAGPTGGTDEKPLGTVYIGVLTPKGGAVIHAQFGARRRERFKRAVAALGMIAALRLLDERIDGLDAHFAIQNIWEIVAS